MQKVLDKMRSVFVLVLFISLATTRLCRVQTIGEHLLGDVSSWVCYYGSGRLKALERYDLVVVDGGRNLDNTTDYEASDIAYLKSRGSIVLTYLSVGAAERWRWYWPLVEDSWKIMPVEHWPGEWYIDCREPGWQQLIVYEVVPELLEKGFDGLYLDNLDVAETFKGTAEGVIQLVRMIRETHPDTILIGQNGLYVMEGICMYLDGVSKEDVSSTYDWRTHRYMRVPVEESNRILEELDYWRGKGLTIFTLDYAVYRRLGLAKYDFTRSRAHGFNPYAANIGLDRILFWPF